MTVVLVCGGRDYDDREVVFDTLDDLLSRIGDLEIVHGAAHGADSLAGEWAESRGVVCRSYPADWSSHGVSAGPIRNQLMLDSEEISYVVAFPGGRGTADMTRRSQSKGIWTIHCPQPSTEISRVF